jgi:branched-chain amino acid transport system ATP-binding protein
MSAVARIVAADTGVQQRSSLTLDNVSRSFGGLQAVRNLSFDVLPGRVTGLIGPNGAGKTSTVNLVTGLLRLDSGSVRLGDTDLSTLPPDRIAREGVVRTFQNIRLLGDMSVLDNILAGFHRHDATSLAAKFIGLPAVLRQNRRWRDEAYAIAARFGLDQLTDRRAGELSYGHQRRVEICRALAVRPRVLLLDEPAAGMNDVEAEELGQHFRALADSGIAVLLIEHNMRLVMALCDDIHVLASGVLIASGDRDAIQRDPAVISAYLGE